MAAELFSDLSRATDANGNPLSGARWYFYKSGTTTPTPVYTTAGITTPHSNPVVADAGGKFPPIYFDATVRYRGILRSGIDDSIIYDIDPINVSADGAASYPVTTEIYLDLAEEGQTEIPVSFGTSPNMVVKINGQSLIADIDYTLEDFAIVLNEPMNAGDEPSVIPNQILFNLGATDVSFAATNGPQSSVNTELKRWVWLEMYGGKADYSPISHTYTTDNLTALNKAIAALGGKGGTILFGGGHFGFSAGFTLPDNVTLEGRCRNVGNQNPALMLGGGANLWIPGGSTGIKMGNSTALRFIGVWRRGLSFNQGSSTFSQWTGKGTTLAENTTDQLLEDVFIGGFEWACHPEATPAEYSGPGAVTYSRFNTKGKVSIDCLNGIRLHNCSDLPVIGTVHCWPFTTVFSAGEANSAQLKRPGWAILLTGLNDHTMIMNAFNYGYTNSFEVIDGDNTTWVSCDADYPYQAGTDSSLGFKSSGAAQETVWVACKAIQRDSGFFTDSTEANLLSSEAIGCHTWECRTNGHSATRGHVKINGGTTRSSFPGSVGIQTANDPSVVVEYAMHHFANLSKATVNGLASVPLRDCGGNTYSNMAAPYHTNRYQPGIASAATIALNGTDRYYVVTGTTAISTISSPGDYIGFVITLYIANGLTIKVDGNINTITGSDTAVAAGRAVQFIATSAGWRQL